VAAILRDLPEVEGTIAEIALRFCLSRPAVCTVIPGMRKPKNAEANCTVSDKGPLDQHTLAVLLRHAWDKNFRA
jgi:aryl-alcohol dehydrogenase-like predicted oxidoreductase